MKVVRLKKPIMLGWEKRGNYKRHAIVQEFTLTHQQWRFRGLPKGSRCGELIRGHFQRLVNTEPENACKLCKDLLVKDGTLPP